MDVFDDRVCALGEGPCYDAERGVVRWVDVLGKRVLWRGVDATAGDVGEAGTPAHVGAAVPDRAGGLVLCLADGLVRRRPDGRDEDLVSYPAEHQAHRRTGGGCRSNDAKADPAGRLWHGTVAYDNTPGAGALYRLDPAATSTALVLDQVTVANGLGWSPDGTAMYFIDSPTRRVDQFDFDPATGTPTNRRPLITLPDGAGFPDGMCVDAAGYLWVALWEGRAVRRYAPDGSLDRILEVPTDLVTSCCFAGPELDLLVITTAAHDRAGDPAAGRTYVERFINVVGLPATHFAG